MVSQKKPGIVTLRPDQQKEIEYKAYGRKTHIAIRRKQEVSQCEF
jgi:hypothetical protein